MEAPRPAPSGARGGEGAFRPSLPAWREAALAAPSEMRCAKGKACGDKYPHHRRMQLGGNALFKKTYFLKKTT